MMLAACKRHIGALPAIFLLLAAISPAAHGAVDIAKLPKPTGYVSDLANVVDPSQKEQLEAFCTSVEQQLGVQFALVTINSVEDRPIRDFALDLFRTWGVGSKKDNQGVMLLLAIKDRQNDIETGRGIEPYITDGFAGSTLRSMRPALQSGDYGSSLLTAAQAMAGQIAQGKNIAFAPAGPLPEERPRAEVSRGRGIPFPLIILGIFFLLWLFGRGGRRGGGGYRGSGGGGFLTGMILGNLMGGRGGGWGGGDWGGGGFGGGSGGGGGFGGFGGGDAGGGGASSNW